MLQGALLQATDGDIRLDTGTLTVSDNHDTDQYRNIGGSIGLKTGGLDTVGFSYEKKDSQGETRTTHVESKLKGYLLDPTHPQNQSKADWFSQALGFNQSNWQGLALQLRFDPATAVATKATQYGQTYEQVIATPLLPAACGWKGCRG